MLHVERHRGLPVRAYVDVTKDGVPAMFLFDTGAATTRLIHGLGGPPVVPDAGVVRLGCSFVLNLPSGAVRALPPAKGLDVVGLLGADILVQRPTEVDLHTDTMRDYERLPDEVAAWPTVPVELIDGVLVTRATVDGRSMRLLIDTGTDTLLLLTDTPGAGDVVTTTDSFGSSLSLVWGSAMLEWEGPKPRRVPAWRTRAHPAFERHAAQCGAEGILGLAPMGNRRLVFDVAHARLYLEP